MESEKAPVRKEESGLFMQSISLEFSASHIFTNPEAIEIYKHKARQPNSNQCLAHIWLSHISDIHFKFFQSINVYDAACRIIFSLLSCQNIVTQNHRFKFTLYKKPCVRFLSVASISVHSVLPSWQVSATLPDSKNILSFFFPTGIGSNRIPCRSSNALERRRKND